MFSFLLNYLKLILILISGSSSEAGVPDMTVISDIDENGINRNLKVRYDRNQIYVSFLKKTSNIH